MTTHQILVEELHKPARRNYQRRRFTVRGLDETWQADLVEMQPYAKENKGYKYLLTVIDIFSKYAWAVPVKQKTGSEVASAMKSVLQQGRIPKNLHTDRGKEFYNTSFQSLMKQYNINLYSTYSNLKASICERFNRTLKNKMWMQFSLRGKYKWLDILPELLTEYNNSKHRTIGMKPKDVSTENEAKVLKRFSRTDQEREKRAKFKVGDKVRVSKMKQVFEKGYTPNWSTEIFTVSQVVPTYPVFTYKLKDYQDQPIAGGFYEQELLKAKYSDVYLVEKVLKKCGNQLYVKWLGFDHSHNSWINKSDL